MGFRPVYLTYDEIRAEADAFLQEYHPTGTHPVPIEEIVEFDLSMTIVPLEGLQADVRVDAFLTNDLETLYVDEYVVKHAPARYRFSLAHEAAHYWLHDGLYQECAIRSVADWLNVQETIGEDYRLFESQANNFAGLVLVPVDLLSPALRQVTDRLMKEGIPPRQIDHHPTRAAVVRELARVFAVSEQTMEIRLERDGLLARVSPQPFNGRNSPC